MSTERPIAVVAAWREELGPLLRKLDRRKRRKPYVTGTLHGHPILVAISGDGARQASDATTRLMADVEPAGLLAIGLCGGLAPDVPWGAVIAANEVRDESGVAPPPSPDLLAAAQAVPRTRLGGVYSAPRVLSSPEAKRALRERLDARPMVVDLESAAYARAAAAHDVPYLVLRAVSDAAHDSLPAFMDDLGDESGHMSRTRVVLAAGINPRRWAHLLRLAGRTRRCAARLAECVGGVLQGIER